MDRRFIGAGVALFLLGALIGWALSGSDEELQTELSAARNQEARLAALSEDVDAIGSRLEEVATTTAARDYEARFATLSEELAGVSARLDEIANATTTRLDEIGAATGQFSQVAAGMGERLDAVALELARQHDALAQRTASLEQVQQEQSAALSAGIERIGSSLDGLGRRMAGELATPDPVAWDTLARQLKEMHDTVAQIGSGGRQPAGGTEQQAAAGGETSTGGDVGAGGQDGAEAPNQAAQGAEATARSAEQAGDEQAATDTPGGGGTELRVGQTAGFEDGAVRVFLSAVIPDDRTARVAVNGFTVTTLEMGAPATIENCELELTDVRQDGATLDVRCDASGQRQGGTSGQQGQETSGQQQGEGAVQAPRPQLVGNEGIEGEGSGTSAELAPGQTLAVGEGKLRLFVSAVDAESGQVRIAVNGTDVIPLAVGETHETNGCTVGLNGFEGRSAVLNYSC